MRSLCNPGVRSDESVLGNRESVTDDHLGRADADQQHADKCEG
jgi:hypothetical protein